MIKPVKPELEHDTIIEILFEDEYLLVANKPSGILVHKTDIDFYSNSNMVTLLRKQLGKKVFPIHRLDKATSGVLIFAFDKLTAQLLCQIFAEREVKKEYLALVRGHTKAQGIIESPLKDLANPKAKQSAFTEYELLKSYEHPFPVRPYASARYSLLRIMPKTGRQHQIRRHLKHIFHPIVGDTVYGDGKHNQHCRNHFKCTRLMLHAHSLSFVHPHTGCALSFIAKTPECFDKVLGMLNSYTCSTSS